MKLVRTVGLLAASAFLLLGGVVAVRTIQFGRVAVPEGQQPSVKLVESPAFDLVAAAEHLGAAIRFQTISHQNPSENRIDQWDGFHAWLQATYPAVHKAMVRETAGGHALIYHWQGSDSSLPPIILMAHQDVVPVSEGTEDDWKHPPFAGIIAENAVWGRGAVDDKGSLIGLFEAFEILARSGFRPRRSVYLVSGHDEEVGGTGAKAAADLLAKRGVKALFTLDEGSAIVSDAPVINGPAIMIGIAEKGYATLRVSAAAPGGHSSTPPAETAVVNLAKAIIAINQSPFPLEYRGPAVGMIESLARKGDSATRMAAANSWAFSGMIVRKVAASPSGAALFHTTIAPTMLDGSPKENVLPQTATALINYRIAPWNRSDDVLKRAQAAVGKLPVKLDWVKPPREPTPVSSTRSKGWQLISAAASAQRPGALVAPYLVVAGTDSRNFTGISQDVYRFFPVELSIAETAMIHGTNEHMRLENLNRMVRFYLQLIATSAG